MKQKGLFFTLAASAMMAAGFTSCSIDDNPSNYSGTIAPIEDTFDEGSLVKNGTCSGSLADNFWVHEWRTPDTQFDGTANLTYDPEDLNNRCVAVVVRSNTEALEAGTGITTDGNPLKADFSNFASWDSQFFVTIGEEETLKEGDILRLKMKVKADKAVNGIETQAHAAPGAYLHWQCLGNINLTTEWQDYEGTVTVAGNQIGMYTVALNLAKGEHYTAYFDDIRVEVVRYDPLDKGNAVSGGSFEYITESSSYWCHEWRTSDAQFDGMANIIVDPANEKNHCAAVVIRSNAEALADGNATTTDGQPLKEDFSNFADWDSQFFISFGENQALKAGDKIQLKMKVKADAEMTAGTQSHANPGGYLHWYCVGDVNFTTEWADYDSGQIEVVEGGNWGNATAGMYSIAFNLAKGIHNTVYFDDIQVLITRAQQ